MRSADGITRRKQRGVLVAPARIPHRTVDCGGHLAFGFGSRKISAVAHAFRQLVAARFHHFGETIEHQTARAGRRFPPSGLRGARSHDGIARVFARCAGDIGAEGFAVPKRVASSGFRADEGAVDEQFVHLANRKPHIAVLGHQTEVVRRKGP